MIGFGEFWRLGLRRRKYGNAEQRQVQSQQNGRAHVDYDAIAHTQMHMGRERYGK
jgi:hypothetical protein